MAHGNDLKFFVTVAVVFSITFGGAYWVWDSFGPIPAKLFPADADGNFTAAGTYGDSFGYVNSLLSSLALAGAIAAVFMQTLELRYQRKELQESQEVWLLQQESLEKQVRSFRAQTRVMAAQVTVARMQNSILLLNVMIAGKNNDSVDFSSQYPELVRQKNESELQEKENFLLEAVSLIILNRRAAERLQGLPHEAPYHIKEICYHLEELVFSASPTVNIDGLSAKLSSLKKLLTKLRGLANPYRKLRFHLRDIDRTLCEIVRKGNNPSVVDMRFVDIVDPAEDAFGDLPPETDILI